MDNKATMIRRQMEATKSHLSEKMEVLEEHLTEKVHSAGTSVNATAVAVQDAVRAVGNAINVERHFRRHPWLFLGGSFVLGYVATDWLRTDLRKQSPRSSGVGGNCEEAPQPVSGAMHDFSRGCETDNAAEVSAPSANTQRTHSPTGAIDRSAIGSELLRVAMGAFTGITQEWVARSVPQIVDFFRHDPAADKSVQERCSNSVNPEGV